MDLFLFDKVYPIVTDVGDELERRGVRGLRVGREDTEGLKCKRALKSDLLDTLDKAGPVADVGLSVCQVGVGDHMKIIHGIVVMDMEDGHTLAHDLEILLDIKVAEICVTYVKAEAEVVTACLLVEDIDHSCGIVGIGESALNKARAVTSEDVLKADLYALILLDIGDKSAIETEVCFPLYILFGAG